MYWRVVSSVSLPEASNSFATEGIFYLRLKHGMRIGEYKRLPERVLCSYRSTQSLRTSHNRGRLTVEDGLIRRPRSPVDGILQYPRYTVVILRRRDEQRVRFANRCLERLHRLRITLIVNVG